MSLFSTEKLNVALAEVASLKAAIETGGLFALTKVGEGKDSKFSIALTEKGNAHFAQPYAGLQGKLDAAEARVLAVTTEKSDLEGKLATAAADERGRITAAVVADPAPLETHAGFPHAIVEFPISDLLEFGGFNLLAAAVASPLPAGVPAPTEPESAL